LDLQIILIVKLTYRHEKSNMTYGGMHAFRIVLIFWFILICWLFRKLL